MTIDQLVVRKMCRSGTLFPPVGCCVWKLAQLKSYTACQSNAMPILFDWPNVFVLKCMRYLPFDVKPQTINLNKSWNMDAWAILSRLFSPNMASYLGVNVQLYFALPSYLIQIVRLHRWQYTKIITTLIVRYEMK